MSIFIENQRTKKGQVGNIGDIYIYIYTVFERKENELLLKHAYNREVILHEFGQKSKFLMG